MREIVLDTETTGLDPLDGHRIVEIGAVELWNQVPTGRTYHQYINPERPMPEDALKIHGLDDAFLADKPVFADIVEAFLDFVGTTKLVIHNASFDMRFLNAELERTNRPTLSPDQAIDTLALTRKKFPGSSANLDALCRRFGIDNSRREKHGALLDSEILAEVYLELIGGKQPDFALAPALRTPGATTDKDDWRPRPRPVPLGSLVTEAERAAHAAFVAELGADAVWVRFAPKA